MTRISIIFNASISSVSISEVRSYRNTNNIAVYEYPAEGTTQLTSSGDGDRCHLQTLNP